MYRPGAVYIYITVGALPMMTNGFWHERSWVIVGAESDGQELRKVVGGVEEETGEGLHEDRTRFFV